MKALHAEGGGARKKPTEDVLEMSSSRHRVTLLNGNLTVGNTDTNHQTPPYVMRLPSGN